MMEDSSLNHLGNWNLIIIMKTEVPDIFLKSDRNFMDLLIGLMIGSTMFASLKMTAQLFRCTERRISLASERLQKSGNLVKIPNFIIVEFDSKKSRTEIHRFRIDLLKFHGIRTPEPVFFRGSWHAVLWGPNSYFFSIDAQRLKGEISHLTLNVRKSFFITPLSQTPDYNLWTFNNKCYTFQNYLNNFGFKGL